ncbi:DUF6228 family protein [Dyella sp. Tek66A03]|uniref:DUF6228 family protein n=1 Tax=Dyella sp. Tek66A03 TaxID=3458298 RepID=UPI00403EA153
MPDFLIKDVNSSTTLRFEGEIPTDLTGYDGCTFSVSASSHELSAVTKVYDIRPDQWTAFFKDLAVHWRGWQGVKDHESLEGHFRLEANTADSLGHIRLRFRLRGVDVPNLWVAEASLIIEAGQLDDLAKRAEAYFGMVVPA